MTTLPWSRRKPSPGFPDGADGPHGGTGRPGSTLRLARIGWHGFALITLFFALSATVRAQVDTGSVLGQVTDSTGALIPDVLVTLRNESTGVTTSMHTDGRGNFSFSPVRIGIYTITAEMQNFQREEQQHIHVDVQQQINIPIMLRTGSTKETIEVSSESIPLLQTQNASVGQTIGSQQINDLPVYSRNYYFLAQLAAGVTFAQNGGRNENTNGRFVANGVRATENDYLLDEIDNNSAIVSVQNGKDYVVQTPVDALADFKIQTNNYNAEFGRAAGAVLNATTKSGTNQVHGDVWEFLRNDVLNANDYFLNHAGIARAVLIRNQFGFTLGGPVILPHIYNGHNRTFFFGDYEGTRLIQGNAITGTVPTTLERNSGYTNFSDLATLQHGNNPPDAMGNVYPLGTILDPATTTADGSTYVRTPFSGNQIPSGRIDPNAVALLNLLPSPTNSQLLNNYVTAPPDADTYNSFDIRADQVIGHKDYLFARYSYNGHTQNHPGIFTDYQKGYADGGNTSSESDFFDRSQNVSIGETHTFSSTLVNDLRLGVNREHVLWLQANGNTLGIPAQFGIQGVPQYPTNGGLPYFSVGSLGSGVCNSFGACNSLPSNKYGTTPQLNDDLTIVRGAHTVKLGVEQQFIWFPFTQPPDSRGEFTFGGMYTSVYGQTDSTTGIAQLLLLPTSTSNLAGANAVSMSTFTEHDLTHKYSGAYAQDDWRVNQRLTLNLGLRYDYYDFMHDQKDNIANFVPGPARVGGTFLVTSRINSELPPAYVSALSAEGIAVDQIAQGTMVNTQHLNFAPRVGFAYELLPKLVIRGGYGIFYGGIEDIGGSPMITENFPIEYSVTQTAVNAATPLAANNSIGLLENTFVNLNTSPTALSPTGINLDAYQHNNKTTYVEGYNLSLQYQINSALALTAAYTGDEGRHILTELGLNSVAVLLPPGTTTKPYWPYQTTGSGGNYVMPEAASDFNAGQVTLEQRPMHGLSLLANFAWQKTISDARDPLENETGSYRAPFLPNFGIGADSELADFNDRRVVHVSGLYELPLGRGKLIAGNAHGVAQGLVGGWNMSFIGTVKDGMPFTVSCSVATSSGSGCNALLVSGQNPYANSSVAHFVNAAAFANPAAVTTIGQTDYAPLGGKSTQVSGPPFRSLDLGVLKRFSFTERIYSEFRAEFFNITNTPNLANPSSLNFSNTTNFGQITSTIDTPNDPREVQAALKIYW